jgi:hypothetical protein
MAEIIVYSNWQLLAQKKFKKPLGSAVNKEKFIFDL